MENYLGSKLNCFKIFGLREFGGSPYLKENGYLQGVSLEVLGNVFYFYLFCFVIAGVVGDACCFIYYLSIAAQQISPNLNLLINKHFYLTDSEGQESLSSLAGWFWLRVP